MSKIEIITFASASVSDKLKPENHIVLEDGSIVLKGIDKITTARNGENRACLISCDSRHLFTYDEYGNKIDGWIAEVFDVLAWCPIYQDVYALLDDEGWQKVNSARSEEYADSRQALGRIVR